MLQIRISQPYTILNLMRSCNPAEWLFSHFIIESSMTLQPKINSFNFVMLPYLFMYQTYEFENYFPYSYFNLVYKLSLFPILNCLLSSKLFTTTTLKAKRRLLKRRKVKKWHCI